jgi:hypothetical protein
MVKKFLLPNLPFIATSTKPGRLSKVIFSMKAKVLGELVFPSAQSLIGKLLDDSALTADDKPMTTHLVCQAALHEPAAG